jgi:hypothetical protein
MYDGVSDWLRPPTPVTAAVHGVRGEPVYVTEAGQLTMVTEMAWLMTKVALPLLASWFTSPAKLALALAVPAFVLLE